MYERSVIVLERYMNDILGINKQNNLKNNFETYKEMVEEVRTYQSMLEEEDEILNRFDNAARQVQKFQNDQKLLYSNNEVLEKQRYSLFNDYDINPDMLESKLVSIEDQLDRNNKDLKEIRKNYVETLDMFQERQSERNNCARKKKGIDTNHVLVIRKTKQLFDMIDLQDVRRMKNFIDGDKSLVKEQVLGIMLNNGKNEKVPFNKEILKAAIEARMDIGVREAKCYISVYNKLRRLLDEIQNDGLLLAKYEKTLRDVIVKLKFLDAEKEYIVGFLDNERMTAINGEHTHKIMMEEACENFQKDLKQIDNLYELIRREISSKATERAYNELYNSNYLRDIEDEAKNIQDEITNVSISLGTIINSSYWRIEGIKNVYTVFKEEVREKFDRDFSKYEENDEKQLDFSTLTTIPEEEKQSYDFEKEFEEIKDDFDLIDLDKYEKEDEDIVVEEELEEDEDYFEGLEDLEIESNYAKKMKEIQEAKEKRNGNTKKIKIKRPTLEGPASIHSDTNDVVTGNSIKEKSTLSNSETTSLRNQNRIDEFLANARKEDRKNKNGFFDKIIKINKGKRKIVKSS